MVDVTVVDCQRSSEMMQLSEYEQVAGNLMPGVTFVLPKVTARLSLVAGDVPEGVWQSTGAIMLATTKVSVENCMVGSFHSISVTNRCD